MKRISILVSVIFLCLMVQAVNPDINWVEKANGVWKVIIGKQDNVNLTNVLSFAPRLDSINKLSKLNLPFNRDELKIDNVDGKIYISDFRLIRVKKYMVWA